MRHVAREIEVLILAAHLRQAHIENLEDALLAHHQVARLDVAMHDALLVRRRQPAGRMDHQPYSHGQRQGLRCLT